VKVKGGTFEIAAMDARRIAEARFRAGG